jgi:hypothetical protein
VCGQRAAGGNVGKFNRAGLVAGNTQLDCGIKAMLQQHGSHRAFRIQGFAVVWCGTTVSSEHAQATGYKELHFDAVMALSG